MPALALRIPCHLTVEELPPRAQPRCRHCGDPLDISQPDPDVPDLQVGSCTGCALYLLLPDLAIELDPRQLALMAKARFAAQRAKG